MQVVCVTDSAGRVIAPEWLLRAEAVHRQLRPQLPIEYASRLGEVFAAGGRLAVLVDGAQVLSVALWRVLENTADGRRMYVDDLVSDENRRSSGAGKLLLDWLEGEANRLGCDALTLDSGVQRQRAHHFYFREGMHIPSFCFRKALK